MVNTNKLTMSAIIAPSSVAASANIVITSDEGVRGGKVIPLKATVDDAVRDVEGVRRVFVAQRTGADVNMHAKRDVWLDEVRQ